MSARPKDWPYLQQEHRDVAAESTIDAIRQLEPLLDSDLDRDAMKRVAKGLMRNYRCLLRLQKAGAPVLLP